jgi:hypothetical protein
MSQRRFARGSNVRKLVQEAGLGFPDLFIEVQLYLTNSLHPRDSAVAPFR